MCIFSEFPSFIELLIVNDFIFKLLAAFVVASFLAQGLVNGPEMTLNGRMKNTYQKDLFFSVPSTGTFLFCVFMMFKKGCGCLGINKLELKEHSKSLNSDALRS